MKDGKNRRSSHKTWLLGALMLPLAGCSGGVSGITPTGYQDAYRVSLTALGYNRANPTSPYVIPSVTAVLTATAGAPDVRELDYTAVLLNSQGQPAALDNSPIVPASGTLLVGAKGGYRCATTVEGACTVGSSDATFSNNGSWSVNTVSGRAIVPIEWAIAHYNKVQDIVDAPGDTAQWYAEFTFKADMSTGKMVTWKQRYQFTFPANGS